MIVEELLNTYVPFKVSAKKRGQITELVFLFALTAINANEFSAKLKELGVDNFQFRLAVSRTGRVHQIKTFLYQAVAFDDIPFAWSNSRLGIADRGAKRLARNPRIRKAITKLLKQGYRAVCWPKLQKAISEQYEEARRYATYKVLHPTKGLNFVIRAGQKERNELVDDLIELAVQNVYRTYPKLIRKKHVLNIMKRAINNWVINMQYKYSAEGNREMVEEKEQGITVYRNLMHKIDLVQQDHPNLVLEEKPWKGMTLLGLQKMYEGTERAYIDLLTGNYHRQFSEWLDRRGWEPNDDLFESMMGAGELNKYCHLAGKFLKFSPEHRKEFHLTLQRQVN